PLATAGLLWVSAEAAGVIGHRFEESTIPQDVLSLHIQSVEFGLPPIPTEYKDRDLSIAQVNDALKSLSNADEDVTLTADESERFNIVRDSGMLNDVDGHHTYSTREIADAVKPALRFTYHYRQWAKVSASWANLLDSYENGNEKPNRSEELSALIKAVNSELTASGLFQAIVGMANRSDPNLPPPGKDCDESPNTEITLEQIDGIYYLMFPTFKTPLGQAESTGEIKAINGFGTLFTHSCFKSLARTFRNASPRFEKEADIMIKAVDEWNRILASRQPEKITIKATLANLGRFDSFARAEAKVAIGSRGGSSPLYLIAKAANGDEKVQPSEYIHIKSRDNATLTFSSKLPSDLQTKVYATYQSELAFVQLGMSASAGGEESVFRSQVAPFSVQAKKEFSKAVSDMVLSLK
ncbi:MAG TPA: hypothetical protein VFB32_14620, partial [Rudaea sp.]|nr:hypothetical protein [Rudaea sp.]